MNNQKDNNNGGFIFGILIGIAVALSFTTKRGRRILKLLLEQGSGKFSDWEKIIKETLNDDENYIDGDDYMGEKTIPTEPEKVILNEDRVDNAPPVKSIARRFFRGIPKKNI
jgi:hypothetical protein